MEAQEILQDIVFVLLYGSVIGISVVAAMYLLLRQGNAIAPEVKSSVHLRCGRFLIQGQLSNDEVLVRLKNVRPVDYVVREVLELLLVHLQVLLNGPEV